MSVQPSILLQYNPVQVWTGTLQKNLVGAVGSVANWGLQNNLNDSGLGKYNLSMVGTVPFAVTSPSIQGLTYAAGPFSSSNYLLGPTAFTTEANALMQTNGFYITLNFQTPSSFTGSHQSLLTLDDNGSINLWVDLVVGSSSAATIQFNFNGNSLEGAINAIATNTWYQLTLFCPVNSLPVATINGTALTGSGGGVTLSFSGNLALGGYYNSSTKMLTNPFQGFISEVIISDALRSTSLAGFTNTNSVFVAKYGSDSNAGTYAAPFLTIANAIANVGGASNIVILDSGTYCEANTISAAVSLYAAPGQTPVIGGPRGAVPGTYGARTNRTVISTPTANTAYVNQTTGNNGTAVLGNPALPFKDITHALAASGRDIVHIQDSAIYTEDVTIGSSAVVIQAALGQIPTWVNNATGGGNIQVNATSTGALTAYGINFQAKIGSAGDTISSVNALLIQDCTFQNSFNSINQNSSGSVSFEILSCNFINNLFSINLVANAGAITVFNCYFTSNAQNVLYSAYGVNIQIGVTGAASIKNSSFVNIPNGYGVSRGLETSSYSSITDNISFCYFKKVSDAVAVGAIGTTALPTNYTFNMTGCDFIQCSNSNATYLSVVTLLNVPIFSLSKLYFNASLFTDIYGLIEGLTVFTSTGTISDIVSVDNVSGTSTPAAIFMDGSTVSGSSLSVNISRVSILNASRSSIYAKNMAFLTCIGIAEYGSGISSFITAGSSPTISISYSVYITAISGSGITITNSINSNPNFLSAVSGSEQIGFEPTLSRAILSGNATSTADAGFGGFWLNLNSTGITVDGVTFSDVQNGLGGVSISTGLASGCQVNHCTFESGGPVMVRLQSDLVVTNCLFNGCTGNAVEIAEPGCQVTYCAFTSCAGAAIVNGCFSTIKNNSTYSCLYGLVDLGVSQNLILANNIFSQSGTFDYVGNSINTYSDVGTLSTNTTGTIDANSTQLNPLYRNPQGGDLRLQVIAASTPQANPPVTYYFNSPANLAGSDGKDMGAFQFSYGTLSTTWTTLSLGQNVQGSDGFYWRNPDYIGRSMEAIKYAENTREDASTDANQAGFAQVYLFRWDESNPMTVDETNALILVYQAASPSVQLDFSGTGSNYALYTLLKKKEISWTELKGIGYSSQGVPTPIKEMEFRQK